MKGETARIILVGAGRFGRIHLKYWQMLALEGEARVLGVVAPSQATRAAIEAEFGIPVSPDLTEDLLAQADGVDIVTPPETHFDLVRRALPHCGVLVEKPLALTGDHARELARLAAEHGKPLMVGHIYRFDPIIQTLRRLVSEIPELPSSIEGSLLNPLEDQRGRCEPNLEFLHLYDVIDYLFGTRPHICLGAMHGSVLRTSLQYPGPMNALTSTGWHKGDKVRTIRLRYSDRDIVADLLDHSIVVGRRNHQVDKMFFGHRHESLLAELRTFLKVLKDPSEPHPDASVGVRVTEVAIRAAPRLIRHRPRIAVIGGGIFGATAAIELGAFSDITLIERHAELMTEVSYINQWRHHSGFHYPRSYDQIQEIRAARTEFEEFYGEAIRRDIPAYYCTSAYGVEIPGERYLAACRSNELNFTPEHPPSHILDHKTVSLALRTDEGVYDFHRFRRIIRSRLDAMPSVTLCCKTEALHGVIDLDGSKRLILRDPAGTREESFDFVINATYANRNLLAKWFRLPIEPLRFDLYEMLVVHLPIDPICITIMDAPFTSLVSMGQDNLFMLSHIQQSVLKSVITDDGMPPVWGAYASNRDSMIRHAASYLPVLREAQIVESRFATRAVNAFAKDFDARPTVVSDHGFGCWSVLGGKIITCVKDMRQIAAEIRAELAV